MGFRKLTEQELEPFYNSDNPVTVQCTSCAMTMWMISESVRIKSDDPFMHIYCADCAADMED